MRRRLQPTTGDRRPGLIALNQTVRDVDRAMGERGYVGVVGDENDRDPFGVELLEHAQDFHAGVRVEVARRLVGQYQRRFVHQGAGDGHPLLLPAGHLRRLVVGAIAQAHAVQQGVSPVASLGAAGPTRRIIQWHHHVEQRRRACQQVEALEHKAQFGRSHQCPLVRRQLAHLLTVQPVAAGAGPVQTAQDVHQRGLAGAGSAHQGDHLAALNRKRHALEYRHVDFA